MECIEALIEECGYSYIRDLLGQDSDSIRVLVYLLVMVHQLKGSRKGIETVLELLRSPEDALVLSYAGNPTVSPLNEVSDFSVNDYVVYSNFSADGKFSINFQIRTGESLLEDQCIASSPDYGFYLGINGGYLTLKLGQQFSGQRAWQQIEGKDTFTSIRSLRTETTYYINFSFDGAEYSVRVSTDGEKYNYYIVTPSTKSLGINGGYLYLGIDRSTSETRSPFQGEISLAPFTVASDNVIITQWFETIPLGEENTFTLDSNPETLERLSKAFIKAVKRENYLEECYLELEESFEDIEKMMIEKEIGDSLC
jgi:hypothetical protein